MKKGSILIENKNYGLGELDILKNISDDISEIDHNLDDYNLSDNDDNDNDNDDDNNEISKSEENNTDNDTENENSFSNENSKKITKY